MRKMLLTLLILAVVSPCLAKYSGGTGEPNDPYQIATPNDLYFLGNNFQDYNKYFVMTADIDINQSLPGRLTFTTALIARYGYPSFTGAFDGNNFRILNFTINSSDNKNLLGLFGNIGTSGSVHNLAVENVYIAGGNYTQYIGCLTGRNDGNIMECHSTGRIYAFHSQYAGGLCGWNEGKIASSYSTCGVTEGDYCSHLGSLVGINYGSITNCYATGLVDGHEYVGGLCGYNSNGEISDCYATGSVEGQFDLGGLCGRQNGGSINGCYSSSLVQGGDSSNNSGGLCGINISGSITNCYATGTVYGFSTPSYPDFRLGGLCGWNKGVITNCYSTGFVGCTYVYYIGGLCGQLSNGGVITNSFWNIDTSEQTSSAGGTGKTTAEMKQRTTFVGWDFVWETANGPNDVWAICEGVSYPKLAWQFIAGDSDNDKDVDFTDFALMGNKWRQADTNLYCGGADLTGDGIVDLLDIAVFAENWLMNL